MRHELDVDEQAQALLAPLRKGQAVEARLPPRASSARAASTVRDTRQRIQPLAKRPRDMLEGGAGGKMR